MAYIIERMYGRGSELSTGTYWAGGVEELPERGDADIADRWCAYRYAASLWSEKKRAATFAADIRALGVKCRIIVL